MVATANMPPRRMFDAKLGDFRDVRRRTLAIIEPLSQEQFDYSPGPGKWSVGEVLDHLVLAEGIHRRSMEKMIRLKRDGKQPYLRVSLTELDVGFRFGPKSLMPLLEVPFSIYTALLMKPALHFFFRHRLIPFTTPTEGVPRRGLPAAELRENLQTSMERTSELFEENADLDFRELICQHALLGVNNMIQLLDILASHEVRHQSQMMETMRKQRKATSF